MATLHRSPFSLPFAALLHALAALPLARALPAQSPAADTVRRPTFARVESDTGEPLADAVVTFAGGLPHLGSTGPNDVLHVQTDARGRAQAKLQPGLCYVAWAVGPAAADGARAATPVSGWFAAGSLLTLRAGAASAPRRVRVRGADAWSAHGPLRYVAVTSSPGVATPLEPSADGVLEVPFDPVQAIEVHAANGAPLWSGRVQDELTIPPPRRIVVRAVDAERRPLAGALVRHRVARVAPWRLDALGGVNDDRWRELGRTAADGRCTVEVPYAGDPLRESRHGDLVLFVGAPGRPAVVGGVFQAAHFVSDRKVAKVDGDELELTCRTVDPLVGSLGPVPAGTTVHLAVVGKMLVERDGYMHDARAFTAPVAPDGSFTFDDVPAEVHSARLTIVSAENAPRTWPVFPTQAGRALPPEVDAARPAVLDVERFADLQLQVTEPNGGPARGAVAMLVPAARDVLLRDSALRLALDARGATELRLVPGTWVVMAITATGWAAQLVELPAGIRAVALTMQPPAVMRIELHDAAGKPVAGAHVVARGTTTVGTDDPLASTLQSLRAHWLAGWANLRTDAAGRVAIPFVAVANVRQKLRLTWQGGATADLMLEPTDDWLVVRPG